MWCEALSSGGVDSPKSGSKNKSSQDPPKSGAFYISNTVESDFVNDFAARRRSSFGIFRVFISKRHISEDSFEKFLMISDEPGHATLMFGIAVVYSIL